MFLYFLSALLIGTVLFKLGSYWTIIYIMAVSGKAVAALLLVVGLVLLYKKFVMSRCKIKQKTLPYIDS